MKKFTLFTLVTIFAATALTFSACTTTDENTEAEPSTPAAPAKTNKELLTANNWVRTAQTFNGQDAFTSRPACSKDNIDKFFANGDFIADNGADVCAGQSQTASFTYEFTDTEQTIVKRSDGYTFTIKELTETKLVYEETNQNGDVSVSTFKAVPTFTAMITNANGWKLTGFTDKDGQDIFSQQPECLKDNTSKFNTDGTATIDEGATKCNPNDPQEVKQTWKFVENETEVEIKDITNNTTLRTTIIELTSTKLVVQYPDGNTITFTAQ